MVASESDRQALFRRCLEEYGPGLRRLATAYERDAHLAEDVIQEICLALWQALPRFAGRSSLRSYVYRIAHNRAATHVAKRARISGSADGLDAQSESGVPDQRPGPQELSEQSEDVRRLQSAVRSLSLPLRQALVLKLEGLSDREIGEALGLREGTVSVRLTRARQAIRRNMSRGAGDQDDLRSERQGVTS